MKHNNEFYRVILDGVEDHYFFHNHEHACAFLLESYFDDFEVEDEDEIEQINENVQNYDSIDDYGYIETVCFED